SLRCSPPLFGVQRATRQSPLPFFSVWMRIRSESASWIWKKHTQGFSLVTCFTRERPFIQWVPEDPSQAARSLSGSPPFSSGSSNSRSSVRGYFVLFEVRPSVILTL